jgi:hypothetical protein
LLLALLLAADPALAEVCDKAEDLPTAAIVAKYLLLAGPVLVYGVFLAAACRGKLLKTGLLAGAVMILAGAAYMWSWLPGQIGDDPYMGAAIAEGCLAPTQEIASGIIAIVAGAALAFLSWRKL